MLTRNFSCFQRRSQSQVQWRTWRHRLELHSQSSQTCGWSLLVWRHEAYSREKNVRYFVPHLRARTSSICCRSIWDGRSAQGLEKDLESMIVEFVLTSDSYGRTKGFSCKAETIAKMCCHKCQGACLSACIKYGFSSFDGLGWSPGSPETPLAMRGMTDSPRHFI